MKGEIFSMDLGLALIIISMLIFTFLIVQEQFELDRENFDKFNLKEVILHILDF